MHILAADPASFQTAALAWLGAMTAIVLAVVAAIGIIAPKVAEALRAVKDAQNRLNDHSARITNATNKIVEVALATQPPNTKPQ